jgi:Transposase DDE domain
MIPAGSAPAKSSVSSMQNSSDTGKTSGVAGTARLDKNPDAMRTRRETVEHPFATMKMRMGATHFLMKTLPKVATEMALHVLAYNLSRTLNIFGVKPMLAAVGA